MTGFQKLNHTNSKKHMKMNISSFRKIIGLVTLTACFTAESPLSAATGTGQNNNSGHLQVFSSTEYAQGGEGPFYLLHTGYRIYNSKGEVVKWVENHGTDVDETPQIVELKPGSYTLWALSDSKGYVNISVKIKPARTTTVQLEDNREDKKILIHPTALNDRPGVI